MPLQEIPLHIHYPLVPGRVIEAAFGWSASTTKRMRRDGRLAEGIHWLRLPGSGQVRFNVRLIEDLLANQGDPIAHDRAIQAYLSTLSSNRRKAG